MHSVFKRKYANWAELEQEIQKIIDDAEKGRVFEQFVFFYFHFHRSLYQLRSIYARVFPDQAIPYKVIQELKLESSDYGVDGVFVHQNGALTAYQAKFRSGRAAPTATELATFWAEGEYAHYRCVVANTFVLPRVAGKKRNHLSVLVDKFLDLRQDFFESLFSFATDAASKPKILHSPRQYQREMLEDITAGFKRSDRGKLVAACGTGKTLVSLWASEELMAEKVLFLAPSLALIRQTLGEWVAQAGIPFSYLCVCSDITINADIDQDQTTLLPSDLDVPVTTNPADVTAFLKTTTPGKRVILCTYQSLDVLAEGCARTSNFSFDLMIFDEAHRTAGLKTSELFSLALENSVIKSRLRLFMTATERMVRAKIRNIAEEAQRIVFSMDDERTYGPVFHRLTFGKAIAQKIIADYRVVLGGVTESEILDLIATNRYVAPDVADTAGKAIAAQSLFRELFLTRAVAEFSLAKVITFHSSVKEAQRFIGTFQTLAPVLLDDRISGKRAFFDHINGTQSASDRALRTAEFQAAELGVLSNVRCLSEGVDIPLIDAIFFADPRSSPIDIVQAVGRALRQRYGDLGKISYILVPVIILGKSHNIEALNSAAFQGLHEVIQALRDQDETLAEWIDSINLQAVQGATARQTKGTGKLVLQLPHDVNVDLFYQNLVLRIAEVNRDPRGAIGLGSQLGKAQRGSSYTRLFKTLGDYNPEPYRKLVDDTLTHFSNQEDVRTRLELRVNHNNVSHTERLGVIANIGKDNFRLTRIGKNYLEKKLSFPDLFKNQMLLYSLPSSGLRLFPYRVAFEVLRVANQMNYFEFLYGIYSIQPSREVQAALDETCERIMWIRKNLPNIEVTSAANQEKVREELNKIHPVGFDARDVWTERPPAINSVISFDTSSCSTIYSQPTGAQKRSRPDPVQQRQSGRSSQRAIPDSWR